MKTGIFPLTLAVAMAASMSDAAVISGRVADGGGAPVAHAAIVWVGFANAQAANAVAGAQPPSIINRGAARSDQAGNFETPELPVGNYQFCVTSLAQQFHLSTCEWRTGGASLTASNHDQAVDFLVERGSVLRFHVSDPKKRLNNRNLSIVVSAPNKGFAHARVVSLTSTEAELYVSVPFNSQISVVVQAPGPLQDGGTSVPLGIPTMMMNVSNEPQRDISLVAR
jgi:hypothetical protein